MANFASRVLRLINAPPNAHGNGGGEERPPPAHPYYPRHPSLYQLEKPVNDVSRIDRSCGVASVGTTT